MSGWLPATAVESVHGYPSKEEPGPTDLDKGCAATSKGKPDGSMARRGVRQGPGPRPAPVWWSRRSWESWGPGYKACILALLSTYRHTVLLPASGQVRRSVTSLPMQHGCCRAVERLQKPARAMYAPRKRSRHSKTGTRRGCSVAAAVPVVDDADMLTS